MKRIYKVKIEKVTSDWGRFKGYDETYVATENIENVVETKRAAIERLDTWWMDYGKDENGRPNVKAEELTIVEA